MLASAASPAASWLRWLVGSAAAAAVVAWLLNRLLLSRLRRRDCYSLRGRTVFVSGAASGLGEALARAFNSRGARVLLGGRDVDRLEAARAALPRPDDAAVVQLDLDADDDVLAAVADRIWEAADGRLDVLVNNAGQSYRGEILATEAAVHRRLMQVNYFGHVALTTALCQKATQAGRSLAIVGISSLQGLVSQPYRSAYAASKHAFQAFHDCLRAELGDFRVLTVSPAYIRTGLSVNALTGSGAAYARMDASTERGMSPAAAAEAVACALEGGRQELLLGPWHLRVAPLLRRLAPRAMFWAMRRRAGSGGVTR